MDKLLHVSIVFLVLAAFVFSIFIVRKTGKYWQKVECISEESLLSRDDIKYSLPTKVDRQPWHWALALGAMYGVRHGYSWTELNTTEEQPVAALLCGWGVVDRGSLLMALYDLLCFGQRTYFHEVITRYADLSEDDYRQECRTVRGRKFLWRMETVRSNLHDIQSVNFTAWDMSRFVRLTLLGSTAGYIGEEEAADFIGLAAMQVQQDFMSWREFSQDFLKAHWFWCATDVGLRDGQYEYVDAIKILMENENSPWRHLDWNQKLPGNDFILVSALDELGLIEPLKTENPKEPWFAWEYLLNKELLNKRSSNV